MIFDCLNARTQCIHHAHLSVRSSQKVAASIQLFVISDIISHFSGNIQLISWLLRERKVCIFFANIIPAADRQGVMQAEAAVHRQLVSRGSFRALDVFFCMCSSQNGHGSAVKGPGVFALDLRWFPSGVPRVYMTDALRTQWQKGLSPVSRLFHLFR